MADNTTIEWTHRPGTVGETWNPTTGCDKISAGCGLPRWPGDAKGGCYAMAMAKRLKAMGQEKYQTNGDPRTSGPGFGVAVHEDALGQPLRWRKPRTVFVNSMSDLGHARVPREFVARVFAVMAATPQHTYQILSKRPERLARMLEGAKLNGFWDAMVEELLLRTGRRGMVAWPLPNVWMGTSIELDEYAYRADRLRETPAAVRFISAEPLLGTLPGLDLTGIHCRWAVPDDPARGRTTWWYSQPPVRVRHPGARGTCTTGRSRPASTFTTRCRWRWIVAEPSARGWTKDDLLTGGSYVWAGRLVGTNCPCGGSAGTVNGRPAWFCNGFRGHYDTYICTCSCHSRTDLLEVGRG